MRYLHQQCGLIPLLHHEPLALLIVQFELRNGLGFGCLLVGCLDIAKVFGAGAKIETRQDRGLECRTGWAGKSKTPLEGAGLCLQECPLRPLGVSTSTRLVSKRSCSTPHALRIRNPAGRLRARAGVPGGLAPGIEIAIVSPAVTRSIRPPATFMTSYCTSNALFASIRRHREGSVLRRTQRRAKAEMPILASAIGPV